MKVYADISKSNLPIIINESSAKCVDIQDERQRTATEAYIIHAANSKKENEKGHII